MTGSRRKRRRPRSIAVRQAWRQSLPLLIVVILFSVCVNLLRFTVPIYFLQVFDRVLASRSIETLIMLTVIALVAVVSGLSLDVIRRKLLERWASWFENQLGTLALQRSLDFSSIESKSPKQAIGELARMRSFVARSGATWLDIFWAPLFLFGTFLIHPLLAAMVLGATVVIIGLTALHWQISRRSRHAVRQASGQAAEVVATAERNIETVSAHSMSSRVVRLWSEIKRSQFEERLRAENSRSVYVLVLKIIGQSLKIGMIALGVGLFLLNFLTLGGLFAARVMGGVAYKAVERACRSWPALRDAVSSYRSVKGLLADEPRSSVSFEDGVASAPIRIEKVSFRYPNSKQYIFRNLQLDIAVGEVVLVHGDAATGKTTLSRLLVGRLNPTLGRVRMGDLDVARIPTELRTRLVGYLPQGLELFQGTVRQNIARMSEGSFEHVVEAAKRADIHDAILKLPEGYDTLIDERFVGLSGSERKRIGLARAIYRSPKLIVLDEPDANLDRRSRRAIAAAIRELRENGSSIVVTQCVRSQRMEKIADLVIILGGKSTVASENPPTVDFQAAND